MIFLFLTCWKNKRIGFSLLLLLLSGCIQMSKEEQKKDLISPPPLQASIERGLESSYVQVGDWPREKWWEEFDSPLLNTLMEEAIAHNPSLQSVAQRIEQAKQETTIARSRLFPYLFFDWTESWTYLSKNGLYRALNPDVPLNANLVDLTLSFNYEFDFWGKYRNLFRAALGEQKSQQAETAQVELLTTIAVGQAFFALKANLLKEEIYSQLYQVRQAIWELQKQMERSALVSRFEPLLNHEELKESEKWVLTIREEIATVQHQLNVLVGRGPDTPLEIESPLAPFSAKLALPEGLSVDLLSRRPDLMAQIWHVEALAHEVGAAKADYYPNINLVGLLGLESIFYSKLLKNQSKTGSLQPALHLPLFTAGAIRANVRSKKAQFEEALFNYNNLILKSSQEVADVLTLIQSIFSQKKCQEEIVQDAMNRLELIDLTLEKGLSTAFEFYALQQEVLFKELADIDLLYGQYLSSLKLIQALGGGYRSQYDVPLEAHEHDTQS